MEGHVIGGEFEMIIPETNGTNLFPIFSNGTLFSSGRAALYHIILAIKKRNPHITRILVPDYICDSVIETLNIARIPWKVYHLNDRLEINGKELSDIGLKDSAILIVNYFGLSDIKKQISIIRNQHFNTIIIEDNVQSFYSMLEESDSDYRFTSLRKTLPLPDGGWVLSKHPIDEPDKNENTFSQYKIAGGLLKNMHLYEYYSDNVFLELLEKGETLINENLTTSISNFTLNSLHGIDYKHIAEIRRKNGKYLVEKLSELNLEPILPLGDNNVPLFIPVKFNNRDEVRRALFAENIFCPIHWPFTNLFTNDFKQGKLLSQMELSLIVDQRYTINDMQKIIDIIARIYL